MPALKLSVQLYAHRLDQALGGAEAHWLRIPCWHMRQVQSLFQRTQQHRNCIIGRKSQSLLIVGVLFAYYVFLLLPRDFWGAMENNRVEHIYENYSTFGKFGVLWIHMCICNHLIWRSNFSMILILWCFYWFIGWSIYSLFKNKCCILCLVSI